MSRKSQEIGIIGSMDAEIDEFLRHAIGIKQNQWSSFTFHQGTLYGRRVVIVKSGVGKVSAAMVCTLNRVPFLVVRTISDKADGTAPKDFNSFMPIVAKNSFKIVSPLLRKI